MFSAKDLFFTRTSGGYTVNNSLRFRSSASAYLSRTFAASGTTDTWSIWVKRGKLGAIQGLFDYSNASNSSFGIEFTSSDTLNFYDYSAAYRLNLITTQVFRDTSAWYHIVCVIDTSQATSTNRAKVYVNGSQVTSFSTATYPAQNTSLNIGSSLTFGIGATGTANLQYFDGYLAEVNFIDGQALTPSSFGQTDATTGVWQPKAYTGTYGTNGFYLKFADASAATAAAIGKDSSGNGNNWTPTNISVTAGVTYDAMVDSPTNSAAASNYCVLNPAFAGTSGILNGNLDLGLGSAMIARGTILMTTGKWYAEFTMVSAGANSARVGITGGLYTGTATYLGADATSWGYTQVGGGVYNNAGTPFTYAAYATGDIIGVAYDADARNLSFYKNGTLQGTITSANISAGNYYFAVEVANSTPVGWACNFGQRPFTYTPPSGFVALNTQNLPTPTIANGAQYMAAVLYNGTSASNTVTATSSNSGNNPLAITFQPDLVWIKSRSAATSHELTDSVRGVTKSLNSNTTAAEATDTNGLTAFTSSGFTVGSDSNYNNGTGPATYVAWEWKANGAGSSNTSGSITSTVSANVSAGFSVVTYTGTGANATVGHGLGVAPSMIIIKQRTGTARAWQVYHASLGAGGGLYLNQTDAYTADASAFNSTSPTSSVFSLGSSVYPNQSGSTIVAYCFAPVAGYSAFGSYTGNGSADGPFVFTGFRPRWIMVKRTDSTSDWYIMDTSRSLMNVQTETLRPNLSASEVSGVGAANTVALDGCSNGFKLRDLGSGYNASGGTYIYACFAENPFKYANAR